MDSSFFFSDKLKGIRYALILAWELSKRDLKTRYASSYAGVAWNIGVPMLYALINVVVFSALMNGRMGQRYGDIPFALFYFVPFMMWQLFSEMVSRSTGILREYAFLISKIAFPVWVLPLVPLMSAMLGQLVIAAAIVFLLVFKDVPLGSHAALFLIIWTMCLVMTLGVCYLISALSIYIHDLIQVIPVGLTILFWLTPILYPATLVEENGGLWLRKVIMEFNPFSYFTELSRKVVFDLPGVDFPIFFELGAFATTTFVIGFVVFRKLRSGFSDVL